MGTCARGPDNRLDSLYGKYIPTIKKEAVNKTQEPKTPQVRNVNTDPSKAPSLKEILKSSENEQKKKDHEDFVKRIGKGGQPIPFVLFDESELTVDTPTVPSFDYAALMKH